MHYAPDFRSVPLIEFCCIFVGLYSKSLEALVRKGVDLSNPDCIKAALAVSSWSNSMKRVLVSAYQKYVVLNNLKRIPPKYSHTCRLPFIPLEKGD